MLHLQFTGNPGDTAQDQRKQNESKVISTDVEQLYVGW